MASSMSASVGRGVSRSRTAERRYRLNAKPLERVAGWVAVYERFWAEKLDTLGEYLGGNS
jgi:hypothetical protein